MSIEFADHQEKFGKLFESCEFWPEIGSGKTIGDLGCGGGALTRKLASQFSKSKFLGIDIKPEIIEVAKKRALLAHLGNVEFHIGDSCDSRGLPMDSLDGIFCRFLMEDLPSPTQALTNMYHSLKPGGWACSFERLNDFCKVYPQSTAIDLAWSAVYEFYEKEYSAHPKIARTLPELFEKVGFQNVIAQGFTSIISKRQYGELFDWYIGAAQSVLVGAKDTVAKKGLVANSVVDQAISDYEEIRKSPHSFILESAVCMTGVK